NLKKEINDTFTYTDDEGNEVILHSEGKIIFDSQNNPTRLIIKHYKERNIKQEKLLGKVKKLKKLRAILHETNKVAKVGGWEVDLVNQKITWTKVTKQIHEVDSGYKPELETSINFFEEGWSREKITELFTKAIETGKEYDAELKLI